MQPLGTTDRRDVFLSPYFGWAVEALADALVPQGTNGTTPELPRYERHRDAGSTADVDFWTAKDIWPVEHSHLNAVVADTEQWEQSTAFYLDASPHVRAFVKNDHLGFAIPYLRQGERHDYVPDFLVRLRQDGRDLGTLILEVKGGRDPFAAEKEAGARRWVAAVNRDRSERACGPWAYRIVRRPADVPEAVADAARELSGRSTGTVSWIGVKA